MRFSSSKKWDVRGGAEVGHEKDTNMKGGGGEMKRKISVISCLLVSLVMALPMSVQADGDGEMRLNAWVNPDEYYNYDPVNIAGAYVVTEPSDYDQDYCWVLVVIWKAGMSPLWYYTGEYLVGSGGWGDVTISCWGTHGSFYFEWDYENAIPDIVTCCGDGDYYAGVYVEAWEGWTQPTSIVWDETTTNSFFIDLP
jgi:hypothetical protein